MDIKKTIIPYVITSVVIGIISAVYEHFSHGVISYFMVGTFAFPIAGFIVYLILHKYVNKVVFNSSWITLMFGSFMVGVLEIYGTDNPLVYVYFIAAAILFVLSFILRD